MPDMLVPEMLVSDMPDMLVSDMPDMLMLDMLVPDVLMPEMLGALLLLHSMFSMEMLLLLQRRVLWWDGDERKAGWMMVANMYRLVILS